MTGMDRFSEKDRRKQRRYYDAKDNFKEDLRTTKYKPRVVEDKHKQRIYDLNDE
jgi:hypothetical protein